MKKLIIMLALVCLVGGVAFAQIPVNMNKGDFAASVGVNFGWDYGIGAGVEYMFARVDLADAIPLTFGLAAKAGAGFISGTNFTIVGLANAPLQPRLYFRPSPLDQEFRISTTDWGLGMGVGTNFGRRSRQLWRNLLLPESQPRALLLGHLCPLLQSNRQRQRFCGVLVLHGRFDH